MTTPIGTFHVTRPAWYGEQQLKVVLHADHLASHEFDEAKERELCAIGLQEHNDNLNTHGYKALTKRQEWAFIAGWLRCAKSRAKRF
jgi:phage replication-related protein YjqB (UPF0714/DUF867 family)